MADTTDTVETTTTDAAQPEQADAAANDAKPDENATENKEQAVTESTDAAPKAAEDERKSEEDNKNEKKTETEAETETETKTEEKSKIDVPERMKGMVQIGYNDDLTKAYVWDELPTPKPGDFDVLIKVEVASLNPIDWKIGRGWMEAVIKKKFPFVIGRDCSGVIIACGKKVDRKKLSPGMRVVAHVDSTTIHGTFGEYTCINSYCVAEIPDSLSFTDAAAIPLVGQTAWQSLVDKGRLGYKGAKNQKVIIFGGSTAVGHYAIQIAKAFEASEIVVTSSKEELCKSLGATKVYNYKNKGGNDYVKDLSGKKFDIAFDCVGGKKNWDDSQKILKKDGRFVTIVGDVTHGSKMTYGNLASAGLSIGNRKFWSAFGYQSYDVVLTNARKNLTDLINLYKENKLRVILDSDSPFNVTNVFDAFKKSMDHKASGKIVIEIDSSKIVLTKKPAAEEKTEEKKDGKDGKGTKEAKDAATDAATEDKKEEENVTTKASDEQEKGKEQGNEKEKESEKEKEKDSEAPKDETMKSADNDSEKTEKSKEDNGDAGAEANDAGNDDGNDAPKPE